MGSVKANSLKSAGKAAGELNLTTATLLTVVLLKLLLVAGKATDIDITAAATLTINAAKA